jgi:uroporphyrinogen decarboxylase
MRGELRRVPLVLEDLADGLLDDWRAEGADAARQVDEILDADRRESVELDVGPRPSNSGFRATAKHVRTLKERLDPDDPGRLPADWVRRVRGGTAIVDMTIHRGLFLSLGVHDWPTFLDTLELFYEDPGLAEEIMDAHARCAAGVARRVLGETPVDLVRFSEPISDNAGPLVSPAMYERFALRSYRPILSALRAGGAGVVALVTFANARVLLPGALAAGFDCVWAHEAPPAMDYLSIRAELGAGLRLIGGIDLDRVLEGGDAVEREIERIAPLLEQGRYIPLADGRVRPTMRLDRYVRYRRLLKAAIDRHNAGTA